MPIPTFTAVMTTPLYIVTPAFLKLMVVALQKIKTARMGMAPDFHRYVVKVPSNALHKTFPKNGVDNCSQKQRHYHQTSRNLLNCL
mgnify:CR=1 FL=1